MGHVMDADDLAPGIKPLSAEEQAWIRSLERVLKKMPTRLLMIEIGGSIQVVDRPSAKHHVSLEDGNAQRNGVLLGTVDHSHGVIDGVSASTPPTQTGPRLTIVGSCGGCRFYARVTSDESVRICNHEHTAQPHHRLMTTGAATPDWCPLLSEKMSDDTTTNAANRLLRVAALTGINEYVQDAALVGMALKKMFADVKRLGEEQALAVEQATAREDARWRGPYLARADELAQALRRNSELEAEVERLGEELAKERAAFVGANQAWSTAVAAQEQAQAERDEANRRASELEARALATRQDATMPTDTRQLSARISSDIRTLLATLDAGDHEAMATHLRPSLPALAQVADRLNLLASWRTSRG